MQNKCERRPIVGRGYGGVTMGEMEWQNSTRANPYRWKNSWSQLSRMTDALDKLLIEKGVITDTEFKQKLLEERAVYQRILNPTSQ